MSGHEGLQMRSISATVLWVMTRPRRAQVESSSTAQVGKSALVPQG